MAIYAVEVCELGLFPSEIVGCGCRIESITNFCGLNRKIIFNTFCIQNLFFRILRNHLRYCLPNGFNIRIRCLGLGKPTQTPQRFDP